MTAESAYYIVTTVAFPVAAAWALLQWYGSVRQRKIELRWRQAEAAWRLMDVVFEDAQAKIAFELIDGELDAVDLPGGGKAAVGPGDVLAALAIEPEDASPRARAIRYAFNCMLYAMDRLEGAIESRYVLASDVASPTAYYAGVLRGLGAPFERYARHVGYDRALALLARYPGA
jgi:hypothetical protein